MMNNSKAGQNVCICIDGIKWNIILLLEPKWAKVSQNETKKVPKFDSIQIYLYNFQQCAPRTESNKQIRKNLPSLALIRDSFLEDLKMGTDFFCRKKWDPIFFLLLLLPNNSPSQYFPIILMLFRVFSVSGTVFRQQTNTGPQNGVEELWEKNAGTQWHSLLSLKRYIVCQQKINQLNLNRLTRKKKNFL